MTVPLLTTLLAGVGIFLLVYTLLEMIVHLAAGLLGRRQTGLRRFLSYQEQQQDQPVQDEREDSPGRAAGSSLSRPCRDLTGLGKLPWVQIYLLGGLAAGGLYFFTRQALVLLLAFVPYAVRAWLSSQRKRRVDAETLAFLTDLRLALPLQGSLLRAMRQVAGQGGTPLARIAARYLQGGWNGSGLELLERLAASTGVSHLADLVAWTKASEEGTLRADVPFEHALERLQAESYTAAREQLQRIPTRLTLFVLPALLGPAIVLLLYPMVARLLASLGGTGWGGGF